MCDFHSIIVTATGKIFHNESNSHSQIAYKYRLTNGIGKREYWEFEWSGCGDIPIHIDVERGPVYRPIPKRVENVARRHYEKLATVLQTGMLCSPFSSLRYFDVKTELFYRKRLSIKKIRDILDTCNITQKRDLAGNLFCLVNAPVLYSLLSQEQDTQIRVRVARSTDSERVLDKLSRDKKGIVRYAVARNSLTAIKTLRRLLKDKGRYIAAAARRRFSV